MHRNILFKVAVALTAFCVPIPGWSSPVSEIKILPMTFACQQTTCDGELWLPEVKNTGENKPPVVVMAHGFGALRSWGLNLFAEHFVKAGFAVMQFDYRGFGKSGGMPRRVVDGKAHVKDWHAALDAVSRRDDVDVDRIGVWGISYSGGQALIVAAEAADRVKAVSALVPFVSGFSSGLRYPVKYYPSASWYAIRDLIRSDDQEPVYVPMISKDSFAALVCPECYSGYKKLMAENEEGENKVAARVFLDLPFWSPGSYVEKIVAPILIIGARNDGLIPVEKLRDVSKSIKNGEYIELENADHFSPNTDNDFKLVVARQVDFFKKHLRP